MKQRKGFTLAEVLITLGIIGVVAAITLPTMMQDGKKQQLGVKLAKFANNMESALIPVAEQQPFSSAQDVWDAIGNELIVNGNSAAIWQTNELRDGTTIRFWLKNDAQVFDGADSKLGTALPMIIDFEPKINGLNGETIFEFVVTEKGYVLPSNSDTCLKAIYNNKWHAAKVYKTGDGEACKKTSHGYASGDEVL